MTFAYTGPKAEPARYEPVVEASQWEALDVESILDDGEFFGRALRYWQDLRGERWAPSRSDLDPAAIKPLLPFMVLVDVEPEGPRFRFRLAGTSTSRIHGVELTGVYSDELEPAPFAAHLNDQLRLFVEERRPQLVRWRFINRELERRDFMVLRLPLSSDGRTIDKIFCLADFWRLPGPISMLRVREPN